MVFATNHLNITGISAAHSLLIFSDADTTTIMGGEILSKSVKLNLPDTSVHVYDFANKLSNMELSFSGAHLVAFYNSSMKDMTLTTSMVNKVEFYNCNVSHVNWKAWKVREIKLSNCSRVEMDISSFTYVNQTMRSKVTQLLY